MSASHEKLPKLFWVQIALVLIVLAFYLLAPSPAKHGEHEVSETTKKALAPVGKLAVAGDGAAAGGAERSAEEIVTKTCLACHAAGVANAPKLDESGKSAWQERYAKGLDGMLEVAKTGKGGMPPMGADPTLSDSELKNAIVYMLGKAGIDASADLAKSSADDGAKQESAATDTAAGAGVVTAATATAAAPEAPAQTAAPEPPATPAAPEPPSIAAEAPSAPAAPAVEVDSAAAPQAPVQEQTSSEAAPAAPTQETAVTEAAPAAPVAEKATAADAGSAIDGEKIYKSSCFACHDMAVAGAPKTGDKAAWEARIATGKEALYDAAIKGKIGASGVMPPKGGNMQLSDDEIKAVVDYMISLVQ